MILRKVLLCLLVAVSASATAQQKIKGQVVDERSQQPVIGAIVVDRTTNNATTTDVNGNFVLETGKGKKARLEVTYLGYDKQTILVEEIDEELIVELREDASQLQEVIVSGIASKVRRENLANAVTTISAKDLVGTVTPQTVDNALYGKVPGANIRENSGAPGGGLSIQLRGLSSLQGASQPLYIIDGVYLNNDALRSGRSTLTSAGGSGEDDAANRLADINPADIENIEILKGPSASAIYGTRANAGVIIITTKRGQAGKAKVSLSQDFGFTKLKKKVGAANWDEDKIRYFFPESRWEDEIARYNETIAKNGGPIDFEDLLYGESGFIRNTNVTVSGGNEKTRFYVSGNTSNEDGIIKNTNFKRNSIRLNLEHKLSKYVSFSLNSNYTHTNSNRGFMGNENVGGSTIGYILGYTPNYYDPRPDADGNYPANPYAEQNPLQLRDYAENNVKVDRFIEAGSLNVQFLKNDKTDLRLALQGGIDYLTQRSTQYFPEYLQFQQTKQNPGDLLVGTTTNINLNGQAFLIWDQKASQLDFSTQAGVVGLQQEQVALFNRGRGLVSNQTALGQSTVQSIEQHYREKVQDFSIVAQEEINWKDRIVTTLGIRFDKSTLNGDKDKYYAFPRASVAVNLNNFSFWKVNPQAVSLLKLRAAYGETGGLPSFGAIYTSLSSTVTGGILGSVVSSSAGNSEIKPERAGELELGLNIGFLHNRVIFEATYYNKLVKDLIQNLTMSSSTGISTKRVNAADLRNRGVELGLTVVPINDRYVTWTNRFLFWSNRTKLTRLDVPSYTSGVYGVSFGTYLFKEGYSPTTIVGRPQDENGNYTVFGDSQPDFQTSWHSTINFLDGFEFSFLLDWKKGGKLMNITQYNTDAGGTSPDWNDDWDNDGTPDGNWDRPDAGSAGVYVQDASYLKLREVALRYTFPSKLTHRLTRGLLSRIQVGVTGTNLLSFSPYKGYDPEINSFGTTATNTNSDLFNYPATKRYLFNIQLDF